MIAMTYRSFPSVCVLATAVCTLSTTASAGVTFTILDNLPGRTHTFVGGVSADGSVVAGTQSGSRPVRWVNGGSAEDILGTGSQGRDVSGDGLVVVGVSTRAFRWTSAGGVEDLGALTPSNAFSSANGVNYDGSVVVGQSRFGSGGTDHAFRWTNAGGMVDLGVLPGQSSSFANATNADGSVVVGRSGGLGFRWTSAGGMVDVGNAQPTAVSADGSVMAWTMSIAGKGRAVRWTSAGGWQDLGFFPNATSANGLDMDAAGSTIVGWWGSPTQQRALMWTKATGLVDLTDYVTSLGIDVGDAHLVNARISADGKTLAGDGRYSGNFGATFAWVLTIPAPTSAAGLLGFGCLTAIRRRRTLAVSL